ncbi:hypothetical protein [Qipengyuania sp. ASV99]|uniref:hypothetical protein n=1 Tax=Qipengyuania sp. ASV99 TaxID=3399681 RepID=UPI003A4C5856
MSLPPLPAWQNAAQDAHFSDPAACAARAATFERSIKWRNRMEYAAGVLITVVFGSASIGAASKGEAVIAFGLAVIIAGVWLALWNLQRRAGNRLRHPEEACLVHLKLQYQRQYEALRAVPLWYIGPMVPGVLLFYFGITQGTAQTLGWAAAVKGAIGPFLFSFGIFAAIAIANLIAARALKRKIDGLNNLA